MTPDSDIENRFIPDLREEFQPLPATASLAQLVERINLIQRVIDQQIIDTIGTDGENIETR